MIFEEFLKDLRKEKGLTQKELADKVFLTFQSISNFERNQSGTFSHLFLGGGSPLFISLEIN